MLTLALNVLLEESIYHIVTVLMVNMTTIPTTQTVSNVTSHVTHAQEMPITVKNVLETESNLTNVHVLHVP